MHPLNNTRVLKYLRAHGMSEDQVNREWYGHWIAEGFRGIEGFLAREKRHGRYCLGERFTMADVCLVPQVANAMRFQCDLSPYPLVTRIYEACAALDAVKQADPAVQGDRV